MNWEPIIVTFHLIGFALGVGGATASDVTFFRAMRRKSISPDTYTFLDTLSKVIWVGLILAILSGLVLFAMIYMEQGRIPMLSSAKWQMKLTLVGIILLNGLFFKFSIFPSLKNLVGQNLSIANVGPVLTKLSVSGTLSILSWYGVLFVTMTPRGIITNYWMILGAYLVLLILGIGCGRTMIRRSVR